MPKQILLLLTKNMTNINSEITLSYINKIFNNINKQ